jgi:hypothetical protein
MMKCLGLGLVMVSLLSAAMAADNASQSIFLKGNQQTVDVTLTGNATTGYQWFAQNYNHDLLNLESSRYVPSASALAGAGGKTIFTFSIDPRFYDAAQTTTATFVYQQAWNVSSNPTTTTVVFSSSASSNDDHSWQKYPDVLGDASTDNPPPSVTTSDEKGWVSLPVPAPTVPTVAPVQKKTARLISAVATS